MKIDQIVYGSGCLVVASGFTSAIFVAFFLDDIFATNDVMPIGAVPEMCYVLKQAVSAAAQASGNVFPYEVLLDAAHPYKMRKLVASLIGPEPSDQFRSTIGKDVPCWSNGGVVTIVAAETVGRHYFWFIFVCCMCCIPCCCVVGCYMLFAGVTGYSSNFMSAWRCDVPLPKKKHDPQHDRLI
jgi:hypothetical protein